MKSTKLNISVSVTLGIYPNTKQNITQIQMKGALLTIQISVRLLFGQDKSNENASVEDNNITQNIKTVEEFEIQL